MTDGPPQNRSHHTSEQDTRAQPVKADATQSHDQLVTATLTQVLTGVPLPGATSTLRPHVRCFTCDTRLDEGTVVVALASQRTHTNEWVISAVYCRQCAPMTYPKSTDETDNVLVAGTLGLCARTQTQRHVMCLTELEQLAGRPAQGGRLGCE